MFNSVNIFVIATAVVGFTDVNARPSFRNLFPNGNAYGALGHTDHDVGLPASKLTVNEFGNFFLQCKSEHADNFWSHLCTVDSDGDGLTNGEEMNDPCCIFEGDQSKMETEYANAKFEFEQLTDPTIINKKGEKARFEDKENR
eukprot:Pgem_evm1s2268